MDFSLLADKRARGTASKVTSHRQLPLTRHLTRGSVPGLASRVFTCGLMLYELLAGEHPYWRDEQAEYAALVKAYAAKPPALIGSMPLPAGNAEVSAALHRCLSPDPAARPTASELRHILSGRGAESELPTKPASTAVSTKGQPLVSNGIVLLAADGRSIQIGVRTELGKALVRQLGPDGELWDNRQCLLERPAPGQ